jgi:hypothetical protein
MWGLLVSLFALVAGWLFATQYASRFHISPDGHETAAPPSLQDGLRDQPDRALNAVRR